MDAREKSSVWKRVEIGGEEMRENLIKTHTLAWNFQAIQKEIRTPYASGLEGGNGMSMLAVHLTFRSLKPC